MHEERTYRAAMDWLGDNWRDLEDARVDETAYPAGQACLWQGPDGGFRIDPPEVDHGSGLTLVGGFDLRSGVLSPRPEYEPERGGYAWWRVSDGSVRLTAFGTAEQVDAWMRRLDGDRATGFHVRVPVTNFDDWGSLCFHGGDANLPQEALRAA